MSQIPCYSHNTVCVERQSLHYVKHVIYCGVLSYEDRSFYLSFRALEQ